MRQFLFYQQWGTQVLGEVGAWSRVNQTLEVRDTLVWLADEPPIPNPERKDALSQTALWLVGDGMRGGICGFTAAVADAGVCARARAAVMVGKVGRL